MYFCIVSPEIKLCPASPIFFLPHFWLSETRLCLRDFVIHFAHNDGCFFVSFAVFSGPCYMLSFVQLQKSDELCAQVCSDRFTDRPTDRPNERTDGRTDPLPQKNASFISSFLVVSSFTI